MTTKQNIYRSILITLFLNGLFIPSLYSAPYQVFGFHPYWMGEKYKTYDYSTLTVVAYLSYEVEPSTGNYKSLHGWAKTKMVEIAKAANPACKVLLGVTNFGKENNKIFLNNPQARTKLIENMIFHITSKKADGVIIDFEKIDHKDKGAFSNFIKELRTTFQKNKNLMIAMTLPAFDHEDSFDEAVLSKHVDWMVVMSYEDDQEKRTVRPVAPLKESLKWGKYSVVNSIGQYIKEGIPADKLIFAVAYYGITWNTATNQIVGNPKYNEIRPETKTLDSSSMSPFYSYSRNGKFYECWFEDTTSLGYKYDYIKQKKLAGVGIFALGYDEGSPELWDLLREKFLVTEIMDSKSVVVPDSINIPEAIIKFDPEKTESNNKLILVGLIVVFLFLVGIIFLRKKN